MLLRPTIRSSRHVSSHIAASIPRLPTRPHSRSLITIPSCPSPTCACTDMPEMPQGLEIDYSKPLNGTMAPYAEQVLICTGKDDWPSRIEEENSGDNLAADIKELMGRGGLYSDVRTLGIVIVGLHANNIFSRITTSLLRIHPSQPPCPIDQRSRRHRHTSFRASNTFLFCRVSPSTACKRL